MGIRKTDSQCVSLACELEESLGDGGSLRPDYSLEQSAKIAPTTPERRHRVKIVTDFRNLKRTLCLKRIALQG
jgi:hypothetical protein